MSFVVRILPGQPPARTLAELQPAVRQAFWQLVRSIDPAVNTSRSPTTKGQLFQAQLPVQSVEFYFTIFFIFADSIDENTLLISEIIVTEI